MVNVSVGNGLGMLKRLVVTVALLAFSMPMGIAVAATTATVLVTSNPTTVFGEQFLLTATVTTAGGGATGTVTFTDATNNVVLGSGPVDATGQASVVVPNLAVGSYYLMAEFLGPGDLEASVSPFVFQVVAKSPTTTTFTAKVDLSDPCRTGQRVIFQSAVSAASPGNGTPTGSVEFQTSGHRLFTSKLVNGTVTIATDNLGEGLHTLTAVYRGDSKFEQSVSDPVLYNITNGPRSQVNTYKPGVQDRSSAAALTGGGFVVTWQSKDQDSSLNGIYGQRYDASGNPAGSEFRVNTYTPGNQLDPSVAGLLDGGFVVTWASPAPNRSGYNIFGQRYDAAGQRINGQFRINTTITADDRSLPSVAALPNGGFVVVWLWFDFGDFRVMSRQFGANGAPTSIEKTVAVSNQAGEPSGAKVASLTDGGFVVAWVSTEPPVQTRIYAQRYNPAGSPVGNKIIVAAVIWTTTLSSPDVAALKYGGFVVTWNNRHGLPTGNPHTFGQRYTAAGLRAGSAFHVNTSGGSYHPVMEALADGGFVVLWKAINFQTDPACQRQGIFGQRYDSLARRRGAEFIVTGPRNFSAEAPSIAGLNNGGYVATWTNAETPYFPNSYDGIFRRQYAN
jgi:hypothetical protein